MTKQYSIMQQARVYNFLPPGKGLTPLLRQLMSWYLLKLKGILITGEGRKNEKFGVDRVRRNGLLKVSYSLDRYDTIGIDL